MKLKVKKGLDIPLKAKASSVVEVLHTPRQIALNLEPFEDFRFKLLVKVGDKVKIGEPLVENKAVLGQYFVSPAAGVINRVTRGLKRRIIDIVIDVDTKEEYRELPPLNLSNLSKEQIIARLMEGGLFPHIYMRPLYRIPRPDQLPRDIFVKAIETLPYTPSAESQVVGYESFFQAGLDALSKLTEGKVHLVYKEGSQSTAFTEAKNVEQHQISGPHPAGSISFSIHKIAPIKHSQDIVWTLSTVDVIAVGRMIQEGRYHIERLVAVAGEGVKAERRKTFKTRMGLSMEHLLTNYLQEKDVRIISGDPLMGIKSALDGFLGFTHTVVSVLVENNARQAFHFFRLGANKFTATRTYLSGHLKDDKEYSFTTNQHGEERAFIDGQIYNKVMPLPIPTMLLVKAILAEDFDRAEELGILEVAPEDFALPTFICPSKIEMVEIIKQGLRKYALEIGYT